MLSAKESCLRATSSSDTCITEHHSAMSTGIYACIGPPAARHLLKPMSVRLRQVSALEAVLVTAAPRPPSNEDSPPAAGLWLGGLRRSFVTITCGGRDARDRGALPRAAVRNRDSRSRCVRGTWPTP